MACQQHAITQNDNLLLMQHHSITRLHVDLLCVRCHPCAAAWGSHASGLTCMLSISITDCALITAAALHPAPSHHHMDSSPRSHCIELRPLAPPAPAATTAHSSCTFPPRFSTFPATLPLPLTALLPQMLDLSSLLAGTSVYPCYCFGASTTRL